MVADLSAIRMADDHPVPDAITIWTFREALKKAGAIDNLFKPIDDFLRASGFLAMSGQIVDARIVAAPKRRNTIEEKKATKEGRIPDGWEQKPARLAQKDLDARWTVKRHEGQSAGGWIAPLCGPRHSCGGLEEPYRRGPGLQADPQVDGDPHRNARRRSS